MKNIKYNSEDLLDHHGVSAIIKNSKGEILMQEHVKYGFWTIPVGKVKTDQSVEEGLKEELQEECNILIEEVKELFNKEIIYPRGGNNIKVTSHLFEIIKFSGEINNNEPHKHKQQKFLSIEEIIRLPYLSDMTIIYLESLGVKRLAKI